MAEKKKRLVKPWKEKAWYEIFAPSMFGGTRLGESPATNPSKLTARVFETTLGELIDDVSKAHVKLFFQVKKVEEKKGVTGFIGHEMIRDYIQSQIRRRGGKADNISLVITKDGYKIRLRTMVTTLRKTQSSKIHAIRKVIGEVLVTKGKERTFEQFVQEVVLGKLSSDIYKEAKKFCPIRRVEVYKSKVVGEPA
ncbi:MAG: 30S ribosomal protein S3ae [Candidatus Hadarchaeota archaeon]